MASSGLTKELQSLRRLWLAVAIPALVVSIEVWMRTQVGTGVVSIGLDSIPGFSFAEGIPEAVAGLIGVALLSVLAILGAAITMSHARKAPGSWACRFPFRFFDLPPHYGIGTVVQVAAVVVLSLVPMYMLVHSFRIMINYGVLCEQPANEQTWVAAADPSDLWRMRERTFEFTSSEDLPACEGAVSYAVPLQTWAFAVMTVIGIVAGLGALATLWMPRPIKSTTRSKR